MQINIKYRVKYFTSVIIISGLLIPNVIFAMPQYLYLPFIDAEVKLQQGWIYTWQANHHAIDYIKGTIDNSSDWEEFEVRASHAGQAKFIVDESPTWGDYVLTKHTINGTDYYNVYAHLDHSGITEDNWQNISIGDLIGVTGITGQANGVNHLHYEFSEDSYGIGYKLDPFDINNTRSYYPSYVNYSGCGSDYAWVVCPPTKPFVSLSQTVADTEFSNSSYTQQIGHGLSGVLNKVKFKIKWLGQTNGGTAPILAAGISCIKNVQGNQCDSTSNPSPTWSSPDWKVANSLVYLTANTNYVDHEVEFDFSDTELLPGNYYRITLERNFGSWFVAYGDNDDSYTGTYTSCYIGCNLSSNDMYFVIEKEE
ncbi:MAG TPA: M23 family metallopeptidase [Candidatus Binatia bacterium]|nr:M23 family metallopeptidase [Candidatus Binatia bacterium]